MSTFKITIRKDDLSLSDVQQKIQRQGDALVGRLEYDGPHPLPGGGANMKFVSVTFTSSQALNNVEHSFKAAFDGYTVSVVQL